MSRLQERKKAASRSDDLNALNAFMRKDFHLFVRRVFRHLHPDTAFEDNWHIQMICAALAGVLDNRQRLIVNVPPRSLKSIIGSVALPAYLLGLRPSTQIICASYGMELAEALSRQCRSVMESDWYRGMFGTRLARATSNELETTAGGRRIATSVGGVLTGRGADVIVLDDLLKPEEALSEAARERVNEWYRNTVFSRLNHKADGSIILIAQRLHENDLAGHLLAEAGWTHICLPAIAEEDETIEFTTPLGRVSVHRREGEVLHPSRESLAILAETRRSLGEYSFAGQYQQRPVPRDGGIVKQAWLKFYRPEDRPSCFDMTLQSWDTASKAGDNNDYSVCTTWGVVGSHIYLLDVFRRKLNYPELKRAVLEMAERFAATRVLIEDKSSGIQLIQELVSTGLSSVTAYKPPPSMDKIARMAAQTGAIESGFVHLPQEAHWLQDYLKELTTFPAGKHDDQVDSTSQALHHIATRPRTTGLIDYYENLERERRREEQRLTQPQILRNVTAEEYARTTGLIRNMRCPD